MNKLFIAFQYKKNKSDFLIENIYFLIWYCPFFKILYWFLKIQNIAAITDSFHPFYLLEHIPNRRYWVLTLLQISLRDSGYVW